MDNIHKKSWACPCCKKEIFLDEKATKMAVFKGGCPDCKLSACHICSKPPVRNSKYCADHIKSQKT